ncbi:bifunctional DNA primase/polymerase [Streptomyces agglomeratus]|uniref:bifunctional DNA primase/polymerase n=1 Tax=Streptomyces agglomeratus TaxID=285458 RepID=UPI00085495E5|nr:bifunctional DNA primase/polymerase [Streptomyces agglomeratus]OEJ36219.1 DNA primase [Streptomyces agglomeratus]OEJ52619.1 DNA primase [Streptomyces agglomeratus]
MPHSERRALHQAAQDAAARGWHVFPLIPGDKRPAIRDWQERATTDRERIAGCWSHAPYNIGIATGPSSLVVIDLDTPKDADDTPDAQWALPGITNGMDVLALVCERHGEPFPNQTHTVRTRAGGTHLYFTAPDGTEVRNTIGKHGWKVDTRAVGGYVVGAGSIVGGRSYEVVCDDAPAPLPHWLTELLRPAPLPPQKPVTVALASDRRGKWLRAAVNGELERVTSSGDDQHNNALYLASVALGQLVAGGELSESEVTGWLTAAALQVGQSAREAQRTIASGLKAGAKRPRTVAA